jgi:SAM-dependent methyltransferase
MQAKRQDTQFGKMRLYHNWIKRNLIDKYASNVNALLDLSSGKGGDLHKWIQSGIKNVIGYDIDEPSVLEARRRLSEHSSKNKIHVEFRVLDLATNVVPQHPFGAFDILTSMFAFHYMFATEDSFETILTSIKNNLKVGGYFVGCMFDGATVDHLTKGTEYSCAGGNFKLTNKSPPVDAGNFFGRKLEVFLNETVLDKPTDEYIVNFDKLVSVLKLEGLELVESQLFNEMYGQWDSCLNDEEKKISFINRTFVFRRVT